MISSQCVSYGVLLWSNNDPLFTFMTSSALNDIKLYTKISTDIGRGKVKWGCILRIFSYFPWPHINVLNFPKTFNACAYTFELEEKNFKVMATSAIAYRIAYVLKSDAFWRKETHPSRSRHLLMRAYFSVPYCFIKKARVRRYGVSEQEWYWIYLWNLLCIIECILVLFFWKIKNKKWNMLLNNC